MKRLVVLALLLVACGGNGGEGDGPVLSNDEKWIDLEGHTWYREVELPNGRVVPCLVWANWSGNAAGLSCDWSE